MTLQIRLNEELVVPRKLTNESLRLLRLRSGRIALFQNGNNSWLEATKNKKVEIHLYSSKLLI